MSSVGQASQTTVLQTTDRVRFLDGLRGIAAVIVVLDHSFMAYADLDQPALSMLWSGPFAFITEGTAAVTLFFVLSGIALSWGTFHNRSRDLFSTPKRIVTWVLARGVRIYLPYLVALIFMALARSFWWKSLPTLPPMTGWFSAQTSVEVDYNSVLHDINLFQDYPRLLGQGWSLTEEMRFAVLLPLLLPLAARTSMGLLVCILLSVTFGALSVYVALFTLGIVLAKHWNSLTTFVEYSSPWSGCSFLLVGLCLFSSERWFPKVFPDLSSTVAQIVRPDYIVGVGAAAILMSPLGSDSLKHVLQSRIIRWLGTISYSIYLIHLAVLFYISPRIVAHLAVH